MEATQILFEEHRVIERVLDALEVATQNVEKGGEVGPEYFLEAAQFIRGFADGCHHQKEEKILFTEMAKHGVPVEGGPIGVMLSEHEQGREAIRSMIAFAERWTDGEVDARLKVVECARNYVDLLRQHIYKENNILFPFAERAIPAAEQPQLAERFNQLEHEETGEGIHEKYLAIADRLYRAVALP